MKGDQKSNLWKSNWLLLLPLDIWLLPGSWIPRLACALAEFAKIIECYGFFAMPAVEMSLALIGVLILESAFPLLPINLR